MTTEATCYDLPGPDALHPLSDIAALRACCDRLQDALTYLTRRVDTLEAESRAYRKAIEHHAEALQVIELRRGVTP